AVLREGDDVVPAGRLSVDESIPAPVLAQTKDLLVEPQCASEVPDGEIDVRKAVGPNHCYLEIFCGLMKASSTTAPAGASGSRLNHTTKIYHRPVRPFVVCGGAVAWRTPNE